MLEIDSPSSLGSRVMISAGILKPEVNQNELQANAESSKDRFYTLLELEREGLDLGGRRKTQMAQR